MKNLFEALKLSKKKKGTSLNRRPENDEDRKKLLLALLEAHRNGDISDQEYETLYQKAKHELSHVEVNKIAQQAGTIAGILSALAAVAGVILEQTTSDHEQDDSKDDEANSDNGEESDNPEEDDADPDM